METLLASAIVVVLVTTWLIMFGALRGVGLLPVGRAAWVRWLLAGIAAFLVGALALKALAAVG